MTGKTQRIRLVRPVTGGFGFYIRGGAEHGLGIYVSQVETGSEAHLQGLRKGDQILKVCGMYVDQATLREVSAIIRDRTNLDLKIRSGGVIPVKDVKSHPVSWKIVKDEAGLNKDDSDEGVRLEDEIHVNKTRKYTTGGEYSASVATAGAKADIDAEVRKEACLNGGLEEDTEVVEKKIKISLEGEQGLGCSICKGPPEKPGIFVQSTKAGRLAREVGLRPGDQIIHCNGVDFANILFGDAVYFLKASKELNLVVRKRAGLDLFPSESSGYDSSASSSVEADTEQTSQTNKTIKTSFPIPKVPTVSSPTPSLPAKSVNSTPTLPAKSASPMPALLAKSAAELDIERERQLLICDQERLRREQLELEAERRRLEEEKQLLRSRLAKPADPPSPETSESRSTTRWSEGSSSHLPLRVGSASQLKEDSASHLREGSASHLRESPSDTSYLSRASSSDSETVSNSGSSLAAALQSEIRRRADKNSPGPSMTTKGILKKTESSPGARKPSFMAEKSDHHDLLIAEFKKAHRRMFPGEEPAGLELAVGSLQVQQKAEKVVSKPKAPPPPPPQSQTVYSSSSTMSSLSSENLSSASKSLSTFKPDIDRGKTDSPTSTVSEPRRERGLYPVFVPGIPTPDYDSTPDRSPPTYRKYSRNRIPGKAVVPPTVEGISRAKSMTSLATPPTDAVKLKVRAPVPGSTGLTVGSMKDLSRKELGPGTRRDSSLGPRRDSSLGPRREIFLAAKRESSLFSREESSTGNSLYSSLRSVESPSLSFSSSSRSSLILDRKENPGLDPPDGSVLSSRVSQFSRRHREVEAVSMESFQIESLSSKHIDPKPPATYFETLKPSPLSLPYKEKENFEFQTRPIPPSQIPEKAEGEEAKLASQDYRAVHAHSNTYSRVNQKIEVQQYKGGKIDKGGGFIKEEKTRGFPKFTGLKKPAPMPPILRKI